MVCDQQNPHADNQTEAVADAACPALPREYVDMWGFANTTDVLAAANACRTADLACRLVPRPAGLAPQSECGTALRTRFADEERVIDILDGAGITSTGRLRVLDYV